MLRNCRHCRAPFDVTDRDLAFYDKVSPIVCGRKHAIPPPTLCPDCRAQRRLSFRNERNLYHRKCDLSGKQIISMYAPEKPFKVYDQEEWWGDRWDAMEYGRTFDLKRPFFEQFNELMLAVPRISLINKEHDNSEYCNFSLRNKNSYLLFTSAECEDSYYANRAWKSKNICDCSTVMECELCYECVDVEGCYRSSWLQNCNNCADCVFGYDLRGCKHCIACFGLSNASYCIGNKQLSKEAFERAIPALLRDLPALGRNFRSHLQELPRKYMESIAAEDCTGNAIHHSKNCHVCFEIANCRDCTYVSNATFMKDALDVNNDDNSELVYEAVGSESNYQHCFNDICWFDRDTYYSSLCFHCKNVFGCVGLKRRQYCILNKQYTKEEYEALLPKILAHMTRTGEFGEFFPAAISPFDYGETMAEEHFPRNSTEASEEKYLGPPVALPDDIEEVNDDVCQKILRCEATGKPYKIIPQELAFYRQMGIPPPKKCPDQRHRERLALRNPRKLWKRACDGCRTEIQTTYAPDRPEKVLCETCYLKSIAV